MRISDWSSDVCSSDLTAANVTTEDPAIFQLLAERAGGKAGGDLGGVMFMHHRFADYVSTMGHWTQDQWTRLVDRYAELLFVESTEQTLIDRKSVVHGEAVSVQIVLCGRSIVQEKILIIKKKSQRR